MNYGGDKCMNHGHVTYLLIGGGIASSAAAVAIRQRDPVSPVLMIGQEINRPYHRPPLSKDYLLRRTRHEALFTLGEQWMAQNHVELRTGRRVEHLDVARHTAILDNGQEISCDRMLLAIGAGPKRLNIPGSDLPNLFYVRSLDDVERLIHAIDKAKAEGRAAIGGRGHAVIIGGGVLGVELSGTLKKLGLAVELAVGREHPWHRFAGEPAGKFIGRFLENHGVVVHYGRRAVRLDGDGRVQRVVLDDGKNLPCDFAVAAVGAVVNRELLRGSSIAAENAILINDRCRTSDPNVYAAGDCSAIFDPLFGKHRWIDHADHAARTGTLAGVNMSGGDERYHGVNHFSTELFDLTAHIWGEPRLVERRIVRAAGGDDSGVLIEFGIASDGRIAQALAIGPDHDAESLEKLVAQRVAVDANQEHLKDPSVPLTQFLA